MHHPEGFPIAGIISAGGDGTDDLMAGYALHLRQRGFWVRGLVQESHEDSSGRWQASLVDLDDGTVYPLAHDPGSHNTHCRIDTGSMAAATAAMRRVAAEGADLVVFNRFGSLEARGYGFAAEMLLLMADRIPVLTVVPERHLAAWQVFTGGVATRLPPQRAALDGWIAGLWPDSARAEHH